ncbi:MAG: GNAT family N-acetyltransferase [Bdellovibrionota bacterium]
MSDIRLVRPSIDLKESFLEALAEFQTEGLAWVMDLDINELRRNFPAFVASELTKRTRWTKDTPVEETELWAVMDGVYVGRISIRHRLNADLHVMGGHIGYDTRPTYRGRGIATRMLELALPIARDLGIREALLTCNDDNRASIKVIEKNGGILRETKPQLEGGPLKRYYLIPL